MPEWNPRANDIFAQAAEIDAPADRRLFVEQQCGGDAALRAQVESLLSAGGKVGSFLERPAVPAPPGDETAAHRPLTEGPGTVIGPYKLLQHIGEGGFGAVYMAEQEHPVRRKVALKIIKPGMDTREVIARFEAERQALALMDHPNIARVFDAGATDAGRPYFVMELVKGVPITDFCDKNRLPAEQRLKLFVTVCHAIQHAHHKGIIHRDVKPSNVMVTLHDGVPVVKVIDFGVAKATAQKLTERTLFTAYGQMIGTPAYMSPEQAEMSGLDIDMRSDIFSLGVLLYELLTGTTPLDSGRLRKAGYAEMQRLIREEEAPRPSTRFSSLGGEATVLATNRGTDARRLSQLLRSDLDWIVMKALEKDRNRRYGSPDTFAADIERYLTEQPVEARPPTAWYRFRKAARRNKAALTTAAVVAAALVLGTAASAWQAVAASRAEAVALAERDEKEQARSAEAEQRAAAVTAAEETSAANEKLRLAQDRATRLLYVSRINHASSALADNRLRQVQQILAEATPAPGEPDLRGWEWHYLDRLLSTGTEYKLDFGSGSRTQEFRSWSHVTDDGRWAVRGRRESDGVVFDVLDTPTGKSVGRIPKAGTLPDISKGNKDLWHFPVLSADGRHLLLTEATYQSQKPASRITRRPRIWEVATGTEVAAPPDPLPREMAAVFGTIVVGPGAEWVTWLDVSATAALGGEAGPVDVTVRRWEKAAAVLPPKKARVGSGWGRTVLGPDGRTLFWSPRRPNSPPSSGKAWPDGPYRFEVWDIAAEPKLRWSVETVRPKNNAFGYQPSAYTALSPGRTSVAILGPDDIAVHSVTDGKLLWRTAVPEKRPTAPDVGYRVSDDGERIVWTWSQTITVLDRRTPEQLAREPSAGQRRAEGGTATVRQILFRNRYVDDPPPVRFERGGGRDESLGFHLLPDGKTLVGHDPTRDAMRVWDVSPPPPQPLIPTGVRYGLTDGQASATVTSADSRLTARWVTQDLPAAIVLAAAGREYGRIELPADADKPLAVHLAQFLDAGRRLVVTVAPPDQAFKRPAPSSAGPRWMLFDIETPGRFSKVAEGTGHVTPIPNSRYFRSTGSVSSSRSDSAGTMHSVGHVDVRDARTDRAVFESRPKLPAAVVSPKPESFDPTGERVVLVSGKADEQRRPGAFTDPATYVDPERIDVVDTATGNRLWGITLNAKDGGSRPAVARFSPDGRYVLVLGTNSRRETDLSVYAAADGARLWTADGYARGQTAGTRLIGFSPDGRFVVIGDGDAAEVRDLKSGKRAHRLTGHLDTPDAAVFTPDGSRLFVSYLGSGSASARQGQPRLHVWDLTTGRELLTLPSIQQLERLDAGKLYGAGGVLDGSPVKP